VEMVIGFGPCLVLGWRLKRRGAESLLSGLFFVRKALGEDTFTGLSIHQGNEPVCSRRWHHVQYPPKAEKHKFILLRSKILS